LIAVAVIAAMLTLPRAVSQAGMAVSTYLRYEWGILFAYLRARGKDKRQEPQGDDT
jgi:Sec-independent protein secretion pathway component TatC